jgi:hypothetical protein
LPAISQQQHRSCAHSWLAVQIAAIMFGRRRTWGLAAWESAGAVGLGPDGFSSKPNVPCFLEGFCCSSSSSLHPITVVRCCSYSFFLHNTLSWLLIALTFLTAAHRSPQVALFDAGGIGYLRTNILRPSNHHQPPLKLCAGTSTNLGGKHTRPDICQHGTIRPLTDHNDTHDEAFGYSGRNWHGHTPSVPTLRREAWPQPATVELGR